MRQLWYILVDGHPTPCDMDTYVRWIADPHKRMVARTYLSRDGAELAPDKEVLRWPAQSYACVSTVFLGFDHGWSGGAPVLYETMVSIESDTEQSLGGMEFLDQQWRFVTADEARATHAHVVAYARRRLRAGSDLRSDDDWPED